MASGPPHGDMYEAVHAHPDGRATAARQAQTAAECGFDGVIVRSREANYDPTELADTYGLDVVRGIEVAADTPETASGAVGNFRPECVLLLVRGGSPELNRYAVEQERVDVLARPFRAEGDINHVMVKAAADHGVRLEVDLGPVLRSAGGVRVRHVQKLRKLRELVDHYDAPYVMSATPRSHLTMRAPRDLVAVGRQVGFEPEAVREGLREWGRLAERNRERRSESFIEPGVRRGRHDGGSGGRDGDAGESGEGDP